MMTPEESKENLKFLGKLFVGLMLVAFFAFAFDKCSSKSSGSNYGWEEDDFDMQSVQKH
jgi:hypothetical protein